MEKRYEEDTIDLLLLAKKLLRYWWAFIIAALIGGVSFFAYSKLMITPLYKAECMIYVNNGAIKDNLIVSQQDLNASKSLVDTYIVILKSRAVLEEVAKRTKVDYSYNELKNMVSASKVSDTEVFSVYVTGADPAEIQLIANTIAEVLPGVFMEVVEGSSVKIVDKATLPTKVISPNNKKNALMGAMGMVCLVGGLLVLKFLLDNTIQDDSDLFELTNLPLLAKIPEHTPKSERAAYKKKRRKNKKIQKSLSDTLAHIGNRLPFSIQESYRLLRTNLIYSIPFDQKGKIIGITSSVASEYKTTTAINLAMSLASQGKKVLLLDCDLRMSEIASRLQLDETVGLTDYLTTDMNFGNIIHTRDEYPNLYIGVGGKSTPNPGELLCSEKMARCFIQLRNKFEYIIVDFPPANIVSDALGLCKKCDGMIVVARQNYTVKASFEETMRKLEFLQANVLGVVLTGVETEKSYSKKNYYKKYYGNYKYEK